ncbi:hypothetical protein [Paraburkholderia sp. GAS334]|uniref:hypothetical protein n=1 Tax=Paraburkholderia sp. GAS334 TaxID=3035131 RepID=UPI003D2072BE
MKRSTLVILALAGGVTSASTPGQASVPKAGPTAPASDTAMAAAPRARAASPTGSATAADGAVSATRPVGESPALAASAGRIAQPPTRSETEESESDEYWYLGGHRMKISNALLIASAGLLTVFTGFLCRSTYKLWRETRAGVAIARQAANAAAQSALAARLSAEASVAAEQPRWIVSDMRLLLEDMNPNTARRGGRLVVTLTNHGHTAAEVTRAALCWKLVAQLDPKPRYPGGAIDDPGAFGNIVKQGESYSLAESLSLSGDDVDCIRKGGTHLWVFGYVAYRDFLDHHWRKGFVGVLDPTSTRWYPTSGNGGGTLRQPGLLAGAEAYTYTLPDGIDEAPESAR